VLFHLNARGLPETTLGRIGMVSYGVQVRRYFSRFFPQVFGPQVLSIVPAPPPRAGGRDPWPPLLGDEIRHEWNVGWKPRPGTPGQVPGELWHILGDRWLNLYRPNDPLGFPVRYGTSWPAGSMDIRAEEFNPCAYQFTVETHGGYLETGAYQRALDSVISWLPRGMVAESGRSTPVEADASAGLESDSGTALS
jgi:hypothetical protein